MTNSSKSEKIANAPVMPKLADPDEFFRVEAASPYVYATHSVSLMKYTSKKHKRARTLYIQYVDHPTEETIAYVAWQLTQITQTRAREERQNALLGDYPPKTL